MTSSPADHRCEPSVVVLGDALIDELRTESGTREFVGGAALNVAVGLAILGVKTTLIAMVGDDSAGGQIRQLLDRFRVRLVATVSELGSGRATSDRIDGEPTYLFNEASRHRRIRFDHDVRSALDSAASVVISSFPFDDQTQFDLLRNSIRDPQHRLILDPNPREGMLGDRTDFAHNFETLAGSSLLTKVSDEDATLLRYASLSALRDTVLECGAEYVLTTQGAAGASIASRTGSGVSVPIAAHPDAIVDTMGAGDATIATIATSLTQRGVPGDEHAWLRLLNDAMLVAAATCRAEGALLKVPHGWQSTAVGSAQRRHSEPAT